VLVVGGLAAIACGSLALLPMRSEDRPARDREPPATLPADSSDPQPVSPSRRGVDEIAQQIDQTRIRAGWIEAELHRRSESCDRDPVSSLAQELTARARSLEQVIVTGRDTAGR
jgi:hypothetical protein